MRFPAWLIVPLLLAACGDSNSTGTAKLTLKNAFLDKVNVQVVITKSADCDNRGPEFVRQQEFVLTKDHSQTIAAPDGTSVCWRKDRYPTNPAPGQWSGWSRAILFPGESTETEL